MEHRHERNVVLGAGAMGSAAAYHLARRGEPVLLVEQFALGHVRGSSHGAARITRHSYGDLRYARLMPAAFDAWRTLEADAGRPLYVRTGGVSLCPSGVDYVEKVADCLKTIGVPHRRLNGSWWRQCSPMFEVPDDFDAVFEPDAGLIAASRAVAAQVELARALGGEVVAELPIRRIDLDGPKPVLVGDSTTITADRLIVSAGAWVGRLLPGFARRLTPTRQAVIYLRPTDPEPFAIGRCPIFIVMGGPGEDHFYGMPSFLGSGVKVARHGGPTCDPDAVDRVVGDGDIAVVRRFLAGHLPALAEAPVASAEVCLYTMAPDDDFVVGSLPDRPDVIVASPCSGHGFKFSCLIGRVLADLATRGETGVDIAGWGAGRCLV